MIFKLKPDEDGRGRHHSLESLEGKFIVVAPDKFYQKPVRGSLLWLLDEHVFPLIYVPVRHSGNFINAVSYEDRHAFIVSVAWLDQVEIDFLEFWNAL